MIARHLIRGVKHSEEFDAPQAGKNVWPFQYCPQFKPRHSYVPVMQDCFFCQYADFHINTPQVLDVGICCYPKIQNY